MDTPPIVQIQVPPDTSPRAQLQAIAFGLLSKRLALLMATGGGTGALALLGKIPRDLWPLIIVTGGFVTATALICWTWEKVAEKHAASDAMLAAAASRSLPAK